MTRDDQLVFCRKCTKRKMDLQKGLLCGLTGDFAKFEKVCPDYEHDMTVLTKNNEAISVADANRMLNSEMLEKFRLEQNLPYAIFAGSIAAIAMAAIWALVTVVTNFQIGYMALAVGAAVGFAVRFGGNGIDQVFGVVGAIISFVGVLLGNFLSIIEFIAEQEELGYFQTLTLIDYHFLPDIMIATFHPMDLLFYALAIYEGYRFSFRRLTEDDFKTMQRKITDKRT